MSRFVAIAAALALLVSGIAIGALGTLLVIGRPREPQGPPPPPPGPFTRELESQLQLSDSQRTQIQAILGESRQEAEAIRRELRPRVEKNLEATQNRIGALLSPEQHAKFDELVRENERRAQRFFLEGPPPPPGGPGPRGP